MNNMEPIDQFMVVAAFLTTTLALGAAVGPKAYDHIANPPPPDSYKVNAQGGVSIVRTEYTGNIGNTYRNTYHIDTDKSGEMRFEIAKTHYELLDMSRSEIHRVSAAPRSAPVDVSNDPDGSTARYLAYAAARELGITYADEPMRQNKVPAALHPINSR